MPRELPESHICLQASSRFDISTLFEQVISTIAYSLRQHWGLVTSSYEENGSDPYQVFRQRLLTMWKQCGERIGSVRFVVLIDEAERLLRQSWTEDVISNLRDLINTSELKHLVAIVITGFRELHDYAMVAEEGIGSALGNAAYWTNLSVLSENDCRALVAVPLNGRVKEEVVEAVYEQSGGHPFVTQYLMQQVWKPNPVDITPVDVNKASEQFYRDIRVFAGWRAKFADLDKQVYRALALPQKSLSSSEIQELIRDGPKLGEIEDSLGFLCYAGVVSEKDRKYTVAGRLFRDWFLQRNRKGNKIMSNPEQGPRTDIARLVVSALVVMMIFATTVVVLVWAAQQVPAVALAFILIIAVVFNLVSIVTLLVMNGILRQKWAMDFYNTVFAKVVPMLKLSLDRRAKEEKDAEAEGKQSE